MPTHSARISLLAPACFSTLAPEQTADELPSPTARLPEINDSEVRTTGTHCYEQALAQALHQAVLPPGDLAIAQHRFLIDTGKSAPSHCVCVELIHLQADIDNARLLPMQALDISEMESDQLLSSLNELINGDGLEVFRAGHHVYLTGMPAVALHTWPAHAVANGKIADYLPRSGDAGDWRRLFTEVQMLFYDHPVNQARAQRQQLPINAMWFWGGAAVGKLEPIDNVQLVASDAYSCGYAAALGLGLTPVTDFVELVDPAIDERETDDAQHQRDVVIVDLSVYDAWLSGDNASLLQAKQALHERWIEPAQQALANGSFAQFTLDGCEGQAIVEKARLSQKPFSLTSLTSFKSFNSFKSLNPPKSLKSLKPWKSRSIDSWSRRSFSLRSLLNTLRSGRKP